MGIRRISIENVKSIQDADIDLKPITIFCGGNSCGKSTALRSFLFMKQIFEERKDDNEPVPFNGKYIKMGNFASLVTHNKNLIEIGLTVDFCKLIEPLANYFIYSIDDMTIEQIKKEIISNKITDVRYCITIRLDNGKAFISHKKIEFFSSAYGFSSNIFIDYEKTRDKAKRKLDYRYMEKIFPESYFKQNNIQGKEFEQDIEFIYKQIEDEVKASLAKAYYLGPLREEGNRQYVYDDIIRNVGIKGENAPIMLYRNLDKLSDFRLANKKFSDEINQNVSPFENEETKKSLSERKKIACKYLGIKEIKYDEINNVVKCGDDNIVDVGFGVIQVFPILLQSLLMEKDDTLILEQPELHLHPAMQMKLTDFFIAEALAGKNFIIETHSEHLINRLVRRIVEDGTGDMKDNELRNKIQIYFVEQDEITGYSYFNKVDIDPIYGIVKWPKGFFDQAMDEYGEIMKAASNKLRTMG